MGSLYMDLTGRCSSGGYLYTVQQNVMLILYIQVHRAVDSGTGVPSAVGRLAVICHHKDAVGCIKANKMIDPDSKVTVSISTAACWLPIYIYLCAVVDTFKFQGQHLILPMQRNKQLLFIAVDTTFKPGTGSLAFGLWGTLFKNHSIVRQIDRHLFGASGF